MENMFGLTPNSLYGAEAGDEQATRGRDPPHNPVGFEKIRLPGLKEGIKSTDVKRIIYGYTPSMLLYLSLTATYSVQSILTARAASKTTTVSEIRAWSIMMIFAHRASTGTSAGESAVLVLKARNR